MFYGKNYWEGVFRKNDPWGHFACEYEKIKHARQIEAISQFCPQPKSILEIGCAEGAFTRLIAGTFPESEILALDISAKAVERAGRLCQGQPNVRLIQGDIVALLKQDALPQNSFDVAIQSDSLFFLFPTLLTQRYLAGYFRDLLDTLKNGGIFLTSHGLSVTTGLIMRVCYLTLSRLSHPVHTARFREWNEFRNKHFVYDLRVFRAATGAGL